MTHHRLLVVLSVIAAVVLTAGCIRRPLEVYERGLASVYVNVDWLDHFGVEPKGMSLLIYDDQDQLFSQAVSNDVRRQHLFLYPGTYRMIIFSYSPDDYYSMRFADLDNHFAAAARANQTRARSRASWEEGVVYHYGPEDIGVAVDTIEITDEMVNTRLDFIDWRDRDLLRPDTTEFNFYERPDPMTVILYVKARIKHRQSVADVKAYITGMADGFYMSRVDRTQETCNLYLSEWNYYRLGEDADSMGVITTQIASFGLPHGKEKVAQRDSTDNVLTFHMTLTDGDVFDVQFNVGKHIRYLTPEGREAEIRYREDLHNLIVEVELPDPIVVPPKPPLEGQGFGFDAWVDEYEYGGLTEFHM